ncbi:MAG: hypothetical protein M4579_002653 [Chaenotheca gracillima]|nr:MAG: hypothetical protein M4579_002653 [Chaenotheca gracillima]
MGNDAREIYHDDTKESSGEASLSNQHQQQQLHLIPTSVGSTLGSPTALAIGAFATTLTTLSLSLMEWRGVTVTNVYIGNFFFVAGIGMVISAQWELVRGNSFGYTVLSAFGLFYGGFGAIVTPSFGVTASYPTDSVEYNNALGFFVIMWAVFNLFFLLGSLKINLVYILIFLTVELGFLFVAASYFATADGLLSTAVALKKTGGVFCFLSGLLGWYTVGHLMCQETLFFDFPMGDTSRFFVRKRV